jgi:hypothetical protein
MSKHRLDGTVRRESAAAAVVADLLDRLQRPGCLGPARFWQLAAGAVGEPEEVRHLLACRRCRGYTARVASAVEGGPEPPAWASLTARARVAALSCRACLEPFPPRPRQRLTFREDPHLSAFCTRFTAAGHWLDVGHRLLPPGVPLAFVFDSPNGQRSWRRWVMLREGPHGAAATVCIDAAPAGGFLRVERVDLDNLAALADPAELGASVRAAARDDPQALPCWRVWAAEGLAQPGLSAAVGSLLEEIARGRITA